MPRASSYITHCMVWYGMHVNVEPN